MERGGEEELGRVQALGEELEDDAEGARAPSEQAPRVVALLQLELDQVAQHLGRGGEKALKLQVPLKVLCSQRTCERNLISNLN